jgi:hypothetical protein
MSDGHGDEGRPDRGTIQEPANGTVDDCLGQQATARMPRSNGLPAAGAGDVDGSTRSPTRTTPA